MISNSFEHLWSGQKSIFLPISFSLLHGIPIGIRRPQFFSLKIIDYDLSYYKPHSFLMEISVGKLLYCAYYVGIWFKYYQLLGSPLMVWCTEISSSVRFCPFPTWYAQHSNFYLFSCRFRLIKWAKIWFGQKGPQIWPGGYGFLGKSSPNGPYQKILG